MKRILLAVFLIAALAACQNQNIKDRLGGRTTEEEDVPQETTIEELKIDDSDVAEINVREGVVVAQAHTDSAEEEDVSVNINYDEEDDSLPPIVEDAENVPAGTVILKRDSGYRIQLITVTQKENAESFGKEFKEKWNEAALDKENDDAYHYREEIPIYIEFYDPYWKLRVGNFKSRNDAQYALKYIKLLGYKDAWIVPTTILVKEGP
ncbi:MAG TPA: SPOR domain-containing protein [Candidatus Mcinerneyibacteriales bacterium]|nr:SPOR domain-containing protein [Candidatus Mcinerneyibacteriales bacterium]